MNPVNESAAGAAPTTKHSRPRPRKAKKPSKKAIAPTKDTLRAKSKTAKIIALLKRPGGVSMEQMQKSSGWQAHSVRGFLSGTLKKKLGLAVDSAKQNDGPRVYRITSK